MKKFGTPNGAGPGNANWNVGLAGVGTPGPVIPDGCDLDLDLDLALDLALALALVEFFDLLDLLELFWLVFVDFVVDVF